MRHENFDVAELFSKVIPAPEQGINSMRGEVILAAFAQNIATYDGEIWTTIKGKIPERIQRQFSLLNDVKRLVGFSL